MVDQSPPFSNKTHRWDLVSSCSPELSGTLQWEQLSIKEKAGLTYRHKFPSYLGDDKSHSKQSTVEEFLKVYIPTAGSSISQMRSWQW